MGVLRGFGACLAVLFLALSLLASVIPFALLVLAWACWPSAWAYTPPARREANEPESPVETALRLMGRKRAAS